MDYRRLRADQQRLRQDFEGHPGRAWREQLEKFNITQAQMARRTGASQKHINQILQGNALPSPDLVAKMARVLHEDDPVQARHWARMMFNVQGRHLIEKALNELREWNPQPEWHHRHRAVAHEEDQAQP